MPESSLSSYLSTGIQAARIRAQHAESEPAEECDFQLFGGLRGVRERAVFLELRQANGNRVAYPYIHIERLEYDPSLGISIYVPDRRLQLKGSNLNAEVRPGVRLFDGLLRQRVLWIRENDPAAASEACPTLRMEL